MRLTNVSYRITKIGGHAVSIAVCALTGLAITGGLAHATPVTDTTYQNGTSIAADSTLNTTIDTRWTNPNSNPANTTTAGNAAITFTNHNTDVTATVAAGVNLTNLTSTDLAVKDNSTQNNGGISRTTLRFLGNSTVTGTVQADNIQVSGNNIGQPSPVNSQVVFNGDITGTLQVSGYTDTPNVNAILNGNLTGSLEMLSGAAKPTMVQINNGNISGSVTSNAHGTDTLMIDNGGAAHTIGGHIGEGTNGVPSKSIQTIAVNNGTSTFQANSNTDKQYAYIQQLTIAANAGVVLQGGLSGNVTNNGQLTLATSKNIFGDNIQGTGTLTLLGNNEIFGSVNQNTVNVRGNRVTFDQTVGANTVSVTHNSTLFSQAVTANQIQLQGNDTEFGQTVTANTIDIGGSGTSFNGSVTTGALNFTAGGSAILKANLTGATQYNGQDATLTVGDGNTVIGTLSTTVAKSGHLVFEGSGTVTGAIGNDTHPLKDIVVKGGPDKTVTLQGMVNTETLQYAGNGTVELKGTNGGSAIGGLKGTVDFGSNGTGTLAIGDGVNLTTGSTGIQTQRANQATLRFDGSSTVTGALGGDEAQGRSTFKEIYAGVAGKSVTFKNDVYVTEGTNQQPATFYVSGTGTVNFEGNLQGDLVYQADGTVNVNHGKAVNVNTVPVAVTTQSNNTGTLNYLGSTTLDTDIGAMNRKLKQVNFNTSQLALTQSLDKNIYATNIVLGGNTGTLLKNTVAGNYDYSGANNNIGVYTTSTGTTYQIANGIKIDGQLNTDATRATVLNFGSGADTTSIGGHLSLGAQTGLNLGTSQVTVNGNVVTGGASLSTIVNTNDISGNSTATGTGSGKITNTGALIMNGSEKIHVNYVGSLKQSGSYTLIDATSGTTVDLGAESAGKVSDNSFAIETSVKQINGDLVIQADRTGGNIYNANQNYAQKSQTQGHFSNNAASVIAGIAAIGSQTGDMTEVIQKLEIDSYGYGDNQTHLATQVKRLAPIANAALSQSAVASSRLSLNAANTRLSVLRGDTLAIANEHTGIAAGDDTSAKDGMWLKAFGATSKQEQVGEYDGYRTNTTGFSIGYDTRIDGQSIVGLAFGYTDANVKQTDFRDGDKTQIKGYQLMGYGSVDLTDQWYAQGALAFGTNDYTGQRTTAIGRMAQSSFDGTQLNAHIGMGYKIALEDKMSITPLASLDFAQIKQEAYQETGAGAIGLKVNSQTVNRTRAALGARFSNEIETGGQIYRPEVSLAMFKDSGGLNKDITASYIGGGTAFVTPGTMVDKTGVSLGLVLTVLSGKKTTVQFRYDLDSQKNLTNQTGSVVGRWTF